MQGKTHYFSVFFFRFLFDIPYGKSPSLQGAVRGGGYVQLVQSGISRSMHELRRSMPSESGTE